MPDIPTSITRHFADLPDPRVARTRQHRLLDILTMALCAVRCGAEDFVGMVTFAEAKADWLRTFLLLPGGIPSTTRHPPCGYPAGLRRARSRGVPGVFLGLGPGGGTQHGRAGGADRRQDVVRGAGPWAWAGGLAHGQRLGE